MKTKTLVMHKGKHCHIDPKYSQVFEESGPLAELLNKLSEVGPQVTCEALNWIRTDGTLRQSLSKEGGLVCSVEHYQEEEE